MQSCRWCGAQVSEKDGVCPRCGARLRRESISCPRCKREIRAGLAVCPHCGEELGRKRIPWKIIGSLAVVVLAAIVIYAVSTIVPLPVDVPFVAGPPSPTPTEVILPPTATATETARPPTATRTATATFTPVITATATLTATATAPPSESPAPTETLTATLAATPGVKYAAPQLIEPEDETGWAPDDPLKFSYGALIELKWEPVGALAEDEWYAVGLSYTDRNGELGLWGAWTKDTVWRVGDDLYDQLGGDRTVNWSITVVSDPVGAGQGVPISPTSETWMFRWG